MSTRRIVIAFAALAAVAVVGASCSRVLLRPAAPVPEEHRVLDESSRRRLPAGEVVGFIGRYGGHVWLGLPYAQPPLAERRWRTPVAAERWSGTRQALAFGSACPQIASPFGGVDTAPGTIIGSEDCLYLNVYAPRLSAAEVASGAARLPVMVWIHGGGNVVGLSDFYDGGRLATTERVIVVTANYRLGPLGWFRHAALRGPGTSAEDASGNFGTLDLVRALEWVRDNVAGFGGDPERITIFGESAGARNVMTLLVSPRAAGLFHRAIVQSGGTNTESPAEAEHWHDDPVPGHVNSSNEILARLAVTDGHARDRADARRHLAASDAGTVAAWLRGKTPAELLAPYRREEQEGLIDVPQVFADGAVLPSEPMIERVGARGAWNAVPVMIGTTKDENKLFLFMSPLYVRRWLGVVPRVREPELYLATADVMSAMWKATGADAPAAAMVRNQPRVYVYRFDWDDEPVVLGTDLPTYLGAAHGFEIPFVFGHFDLGPQGNVIFDESNRAGREALAATMMSYWAQFAYTGDPGSGRRGDLPPWTAWDPRPHAHKTMHLASAQDGGASMGSEPLTAEAVVASVDHDPRLTTARARCWVLHELVRWSRGVTREEYARRAECRPYPLDAFPWT